MMKRIAAALLLGTGMMASAGAQTSTTATTSPNQPIGRMVVFGDSLADGGYYLALDPRLPREASSFTTNPDPVAPEVLAARLGLPLAPVYGQGGTNAGPLSLRAGIAGYALRDDRDSVTAFAGLSAAF